MNRQKMKHIREILRQMVHVNYFSDSGRRVEALLDYQLPGAAR